MAWWGSLPFNWIESSATLLVNLYTLCLQLARMLCWSASTRRWVITRRWRPWPSCGTAVAPVCACRCDQQQGIWTRSPPLHHPLHPCSAIGTSPICQTQVIFRGCEQQHKRDTISKLAHSNHRPFWVSYFPIASAVQNWLGYLATQPSDRQPS